MTSGQKIRYYRKEKGLTQKELGNLTGLNPGTIQSYETGVRNPSRKALSRIATALELEATELLDSYQEFMALTNKDEKLSFAGGFKYGFEQLLFFDSLQFLRQSIDTTEDDRMREKLAVSLRDVLDSLAQYEKDYQGLTSNNYDAEKHVGLRYKYLKELVRSVERFFDAYDDSVELKRS